MFKPVSTLEICSWLMDLTSVLDILPKAWQLHTCNVCFNIMTPLSKGKGHPITGHQRPRGGVEV
jgi:hypothetical protein